MAFRLVQSGGNVTDPAVINIRASGTIWPGGVVELLPTSGQGVSAAASTSTQSTVFGVALDYVEGKSDVKINVIPFADGQIWEADCNRAAATAHIGFKNMLLDSKYLNLIATDADGHEGVFEVLDVTSVGTGSGKVLGRFAKYPRTAG